MNKTYNRKKVITVGLMFIFIGIILTGRLCYLMVAKSSYYMQRADSLHERERSIKAPRGLIYDRNGVLLAGNIPVCTISVIHSQITDKELVINTLSTYLDIDRADIEDKVNKVSIREKIKSNVDKSIADEIRALDIDGIMVDEDYKRYYPFEQLASRILGFTGADNQGIVGLEVKYDEVLSGTPGSINTLTDAKGIEIENAAEIRVEPEAGHNLYISVDSNIQMYVEQAANKVLTSKQAKGVSCIVMNPNNGEIYAMVNVPEYNLNEPYKLNYEFDESSVSDEEYQDLLNKMWRNFCINDTYEPGSTFKIVTATAALEEGVVTENDTFSCPGFRIVEDRRIRCHKTTGHGVETFKQGIMNSCNPVFMDVGARVGATNMYKYYRLLGLFDKTGVDLPGEANSIMHKLDDIGAVELATMSFGQSFQITPLQLIRAASVVVNGGNEITPHFAIKEVDNDGNVINDFSFKGEQGVISEGTSLEMRSLLEAVISEGTGHNAYIEGYRIGGKTATSEKLPRGNGKYISSFIGFVPADNPQIITLILIDEPVGIYYGGTIAAPVVKEIYENILPYLGIESNYTEENTTENSVQ